MTSADAPALADHVQRVVDNEVAHLYDDLNNASGDALRGEWSMRCEWLLERIFDLVGIGGVVPPLRETAMSAAFYNSIRGRLEKQEAST